MKISIVIKSSGAFSLPEVENGLGGRYDSEDGVYYFDRHVEDGDDINEMLEVVRSAAVGIKIERGREISVMRFFSDVVDGVLRRANAVRLGPYSFCVYKGRDFIRLFEEVE